MPVKACSPGSVDRNRSLITHEGLRGGVKVTLRFSASRNKVNAIDNNEI